MKYCLALCVLGLLYVSSFYEVDACSEEICGAIVSKCMLIQSCACDMSDKNDCDCCKNCSVCLGDKYTDCCSCVGMCKTDNPEEDLANISSLQHISDPIPALFRALTENVDELSRWSSYTYLATSFKPGKNIMRINETKMVHSKTSSEANCTVAFLSSCMSMNTCQKSCKSMGSALYRWFHQDGCCQCVGSTCLGEGLHEPICDNCPEKEKEEVNEVMQEELLVQTADDTVDKFHMDMPVADDNEDDDDDDLDDEDFDEDFDEDNLF